MGKQLTLIGMAAIIAILFLVSDTLIAKAKAQDKPMPLKDGVADSFNPHYTGKYCRECHAKTPQKGGEIFLKYGGDFNKLCGRCHGNTPGDYLHPVDVVPSEEKRTNIPAELPLRDGKITCSTCHNLYLQCQQSQIKVTSLRGAPYQNRTDLCFKCHKRQEYMMLNAHKQINENGEVVTASCLYCHAEIPAVNKASFKDIKLIGKLAVICQRCHVIAGNHSGNFNHMVKPSAKALAKMKQMEGKFNIILPLDEDGKLTCITCHNPHQRGVIPTERAGAKGADSKFRHRLPGKLCIECHQM